MDKCLNPPSLVPILRYSPTCLAMPEGLVPWVFGSAGLSGVSARVVPDTVSVNPQYMRISYPTYSYLDDQNCIRSSPKITVTISGYCCNGIPRLHVLCEKERNVATMEYILIPNTSKVLAIPLVSDACLRKFAKGGEPVETTREALSSWLNVTYNESRVKSTLGVAGFFNQLMSPNVLTALCSGCASLSSSTTVMSDLSWMFISDQYGYTPPGEEPFKPNSGDVRFAYTDRIIGVVDTTNRAAKIFIRAELTCSDDVIYEINGFMQEECFDANDEDPDEHPTKDDPAWEKACPDFEYKPDQCTRYLTLARVSSDAIGVYTEPFGDDGLRVIGRGILMGRYIIRSSYAYTKSVARTKTITQYFYDGTTESWLETECVDEMTGDNNIIATFDMPICLLVTDGPVLATEFTAGVLYYDDSSAGKAFRLACNAAIYGLDLSSTNCDEDAERPPQPTITKPEIKLDNKGGTCFLKGKFTVSLTARVKVPKAMKRPLDPKGRLAPSLDAAKDDIEVAIQKSPLLPQFEKMRITVKEAIQPE